MKSGVRYNSLQTLAYSQVADSMNISLPGELEQFVENQVSLGAYSTPSEVVGDALRLLQLHDRERQALVDDLRKNVAVGIDQLDRGDTVSAAEVFAELRERNARVQAGARP
jgi:antitoxin ParD1/3/4